MGSSAHPRAEQLMDVIGPPSPPWSPVVPDAKPPAPNDPSPLPFGPFVLERRIAVGGTAEVFYARPRHGQRPAPQLVIKRLLPERCQEDLYQALSREAALHRAVRHENVVTVFGAHTLAVLITTITGSFLCGRWLPRT